MRRLPGPASRPLCEGVHTPEAHHELLRDWQRTQTQSSVRTLRGLRQQMDVWFCLMQEPSAERHCCVTAESDQTHCAPSGARNGILCFSLDFDLHRWAIRHVWSAASLQAKNDGDGLVCANVSGLFVSYCSWHLMECAALASYLVTQSRTTLTSTRFRERRVRPFCHLIVRQQTWREIIIQSAAVAAGLRLWESRMRFPSPAPFARRQLQAGSSLASNGGRYASPFASTAHAMRASLLAKATAATLL